MTTIETEINSEIKPRFGEVYKCAFYEDTVGMEIKGFRPVLVISTKWYNEESKRITILPLTRAFNRQGQPKRVYVWEVRIKVANQEGKILTDQIHNIDRQRLKKKIGELSSEKMEMVMKQLRMLINFFPERTKAKL